MFELNILGIVYLCVTSIVLLSLVIAFIVFAAKRKPTKGGTTLFRIFDVILLVVSVIIAGACLLVRFELFGLSVSDADGALALLHDGNQLFAMPALGGLVAIWQTTVGLLLIVLIPEFALIALIACGIRRHKPKKVDIASIAKSLQGDLDLDAEERICMQFEYGIPTQGEPTDATLETAIYPTDKEDDEFVYTIIYREQGAHTEIAEIEEAIEEIVDEVEEIVGEIEEEIEVEEEIEDAIEIEEEFEVTQPVQKTEEEIEDEQYLSDMIFGGEEEIEEIEEAPTEEVVEEEAEELPQEVAAVEEPAEPRRIEIDPSKIIPSTYVPKTPDRKAELKAREIAYIPVRQPERREKDYTVFPQATKIKYKHALTAKHNYGGRERASQVFGEYLDGMKKPERKELETVVAVIEFEK